MLKTPKKKRAFNHYQLHKTPTGIKGFDEITEGGLPKNRTTLFSGSTGTGKTLLGIDFLINGAVNYNEPGVFMSFEETEGELYEDVASLNLNLQKLVSQKKILLDHVLLERRDIQEKGDFNLEGLFVRLEHAIDSIGAKRVVLDSIESVFAGVTDAGILRLEIKRLFRWLKEKQVTAIITGELAQGSFTRHGLEEYISDCIILLDNRVREQISTRRTVWQPGGSPTAIYRLDLKTRDVKTVNNSEGTRLLSLSPDGNFIATLSSDTNQVLLLDLKADKKTELTKMTAWFPVWSRDGNYVYFSSTDQGEPAFYRVQIKNRKVERVASLKDVKRPTSQSFGSWTGLTPDDAPLALRDISTYEIYAFDWQLP